jgi:hypothetical protein
MTKASDAILAVLRDINATPDKPIVMFEIGIPLVVDQKFAQDEVLNALFWLQSEGVIELLGDNRLRLVKPLPDATGV